MTTATTVNPKMAKALDGVLGAGVSGMLAGLFEQMEWAEDEITKAQRRHPARADLIYHSFSLLTPKHELMGTEFVYRSHCAELLNRVAAGTDTRPGTAAEVACACCDASQVAPLTSTAAGLYARMWQQAFPGHGDQWTDSGEHYEALHGSQIDDLERWSRRKLAHDDRTLDFDCGGMHHGETVNCRAAAQMAASRKRKPAPAAELPGPDAGAQAAAEAAGMLFAFDGEAA